MTDPTPLPIPPLETVWPPAPLHNAVPPPLFVSAEGVEVTQSGGKLVLVNKPIRVLILLEICLFAISLAPSLIIFWVPSFHQFILLHLLIYVALVGSLCLIMLLAMAFVWCIFNLYLSLGKVVLDKTAGTVRANGRLRPIGTLEAIRVYHGRKTRFATGFSLQLVWTKGGVSAKTPLWKRVLKRIGAKTSVLGAVRKEENAEKIAAAIAEFAGVSVQHQRR